MAKMNKKWVILCSTAVAAIYSSGYFSTEAQAVKMNAQPPVQVSMQSNVNHTNVNQSSGNQTSAKQTNSSQTSASSANASQATLKYKNGSFTGTGMNRRGELEVAVTLNNDKIIDVQISNWGMHYSESDITDLPNQVVQRQSTQVDNVSGATYSTTAFTDAVQDALNQAQNS